MWWILALLARVVLSATTFTKDYIITLCSTSALNSPFLLAVLVALMLNSLFFTLALAILDPSTKLSANSILLGMFTRPPITLDFRLMVQLVSLSWKLRKPLYATCRIFFTAFRVLLAARRVVCSAYFAVRAVYPVYLAFSRVLLAYLRVLLATYRVAMATYLLSVTASRFDLATLSILFVAIRALLAELVHLVVLIVRLSIDGTILTKQVSQLACFWTSSLVALSWSLLRSASYAAIAALYSGVCPIVLMELAAFRMCPRTRMLTYLRLLSLPFTLQRYLAKELMMIPAPTAEPLPVVPAKRKLIAWL